MDRRRFLARAACAASMIPTGLQADAAPLKLRDLYEKNLSFSALARSLEGTRVTVAGFMAPPLRAESEFFVLTKMPMAT